MDPHYGTCLIHMLSDVARAFPDGRLVHPEGKNERNEGLCPCT